jgi:DMSO/TMAO reductase YedYZ molybdopterin-dependent catalytic subunit
MRFQLILVSAIFPVFLFSCQSNNKQPKQQSVKKDTSTNNPPMKCGGDVTKEDSARYYSSTIKISGAVVEQLSLTVDSLKKMNVVTINNYKITCMSGMSVSEDSVCKGVLLKDILDRAAIQHNDHKDRNFYIVARASDGYMATFSWAELYNTNTGDSTYVLFEKNGQPIGAKGAMVLICNSDIKTGVRHVYWLKSIEVNRVQ